MAEPVPQKRFRPPVDDPKEMPFLDHLEELRWHLIRGLIAILLAAVIAFVFLPSLFQWIVLAPFSPNFPTNQMLCWLTNAWCSKNIPVRFLAISPTEQFVKSIVIALGVGFIVAFPYMVWELWRFVKPGLTPEERKSVKGAVFLVSFLFFLGAGFGYFILTPFTLAFFSHFQISPLVENQWRIGSVVGLIFQLTIASGLLFQMPLVLSFLGRIGILSSELMKRYRRHAIVVILVIAGILTPSPDVISQLVLATPMFLLYEVSHFLVKRQERRILKGKQP
jgi:sec-independent protein translocase protein TatC